MFYIFCSLLISSMLLFFYISLIFPMLIPIKSLWVIPLLYKLLFFLEFRNILKLLSLENRNSVCTEIKILERICSARPSETPLNDQLRVLWYESGVLVIYLPHLTPTLREAQLAVVALLDSIESQAWCQRSADSQGKSRLWCWLTQSQVPHFHLFLEFCR